MARAARPSCGRRGLREFPPHLRHRLLYLLRPARGPCVRQGLALDVRTRAHAEPASSRPASHKPKSATATAALSRSWRHETPIPVRPSCCRDLPRTVRHRLRSASTRLPADVNPCRRRSGMWRSSRRTASFPARGDRRFRATENHGRRANERVADNTAEPGRQRPCPAMRPAACKACRDYGAEDPAREPHCLAVEGAMVQHAPAPHRDRQDQHDRAETENLHQQIGADRAGIADDIANCAGRRVTEAGILAPTMS